MTASTVILDEQPVVQHSRVVQDQLIYSSYPKRTDTTDNSAMKRSLEAATPISIRLMHTPSCWQRRLEAFVGCLASLV